MGRSWCRNASATSCEAALRFGIVSDDRFAADIAGCGDQRTAEFRQQKMMQRTVGQKHAQLGKVRRESPG